MAVARDGGNRVSFRVIQCASMTVAEVAAHPAWLVPVLIGFSCTLLSVLAYLYMQGCRSSNEEHREPCSLASRISVEVRVLLIRAGGSAPRVAGTAVGL